MIPEWVAALHGHALNFDATFEDDEDLYYGAVCACLRWWYAPTNGSSADWPRWATEQWAEHVTWNIASMVSHGGEPFELDELAVGSQFNYYTFPKGKANA